MDIKKVVLSAAVVAGGVTAAQKESSAQEAPRGHAAASGHVRVGTDVPVEPGQADEERIRIGQIRS